MKCVILQPSYIPWRGYFHQIAEADCFIFLDDVQYDKRGWRNRNRIKTPQGLRWLTIPVYAKGCQTNGTRICDILICPDTPWAAKHWHTLELAYKHSPFFEVYAPLLQWFYSKKWEYLADLTIALTIALARELGLDRTRFVRASHLEVHGRKTDRLLSLLRHTGATHYLTGPSARNYLEEGKLLAAGISVEYMAYDYPEYPQLYPPFQGEVSVVDLLFMAGSEAMRKFVKPAAEPITNL